VTAGTVVAAGMVAAARDMVLVTIEEEL